MGSHAAGAAAFLGKELVAAVLADFRTAPISDQEKALLAFIDKVNKNSIEIRQNDIDLLHAAGWNDEAIYDAVTVCALFNFYNRWVDATGVQDMPQAMYEMSGQRLKEHGYTTVTRSS